MAGGLRSVAWRNLTRRKARYALTALGIVLGVANVFAVLVTNASTNHVFASTATGQAGGADVVGYPRKPDAPFSSELVDRFRHAGGTRAVSVLAGFDAIKRRHVTVTLNAVDRIGVREFLRPRSQEGRLMRAGAAEMVISRRASHLLGLHIGDRWSVNLSSYRRGVHWNETGPLVRLHEGVPTQLRLKITGIVADPLRNDPSFATGSFTSLEYAWKVLDPGFANEVRIYLPRNVNAETWLTKHQRDFPEAEMHAVGPPTDFRRFLSVLQGAMSGAAAIAVFVGAFLIYLTFSMNVIERTRLLGTLHAVGASSRQVTRAILAEALGLGAFATVAGLGFGLVAARAMLPITSRVVGVSTPAIVVSPGAVIAAIAVGMIATFAGSFVPARRAGRISPVEAIRGDQTLTAKPSRVWIVGAVLVAASTAASIASRGIEAPSVYAQIGTLALLLGSVLVLPPLIGPLARSARSLFRRRSGGLGDVAVMHLVRERSHSAYTLGLVMVVLAMMLAVAAANGSIGHAGLEWVDKRFGADLIASRDAIPPGTEKRIERVPGVSGVTWVTLDQGKIFDPKPGGINIVIIDPHSFFRIAGFPFSEGDDRSAERALARGGSVLLPASYTSAHRGDRVTFGSKRGRRSFRIAGLYTSLGGGPEVGAIVGVRDASFFHEGELTRNVLYMNVAPGASVAATRTAIDNALVTGNSFRQRPTFGPQGGVGRSGYYFVTGAQIKAEAHRQLRSYFALFYAVLFVAVLVGLLGLANTMAMAVVRRFREIGVLQAIGAPPRAVRRMVQAETVLMVTTAFVLSIALGTLVAWLIVKGAGGLLGFNVAFIFPWRWVPALAIMSAVIAIASAASPARRASRLTPVEALRYE